MHTFPVWYQNIICALMKVYTQKILTLKNKCDPYATFFFIIIVVGVVYQNKVHQLLCTEHLHIHAMGITFMHTYSNTLTTPILL